MMYCAQVTAWTRSVLVPTLDLWVSAPEPQGDKQSCTNQTHRYCHTLRSEALIVSKHWPIWIKWQPNHNSGTSHITQGRLSHAEVWPRLSAHATTGDEQEQAKDTADRCVKLVLPTAHNHRHTLSERWSWTCTAASFATQDWKKKKKGSSAGRSFSAAGASWPEKTEYSRVWLPFLRCSGMESIPGISPRCVLATSAKQTLVNGGEVTSSRRIPQCAHKAWTPLEAHFCPGKTVCRLSNPRNVQCTMQSSWDERQPKHTFSNCWLFGELKPLTLHAEFERTLKWEHQCHTVRQI